MTFVALDLETSPDGCFDYVQVSDGNHPLAAVGPEICGTAVPSPITSYGSSLVVDFISDGSNHGSGFKMFYSTAGSGKSICPGISHGHGKVIAVRESVLGRPAKVMGKSKNVKSQGKIHQTVNYICNLFL